MATTRREPRQLLYETPKREIQQQMLPDRKSLGQKKQSTSSIAGPMRCGERLPTKVIPTIAKSGDDLHAFEPGENDKDDDEESYESYPEYYPEEDQDAGGEDDGHDEPMIMQPSKIQTNRVGGHARGKSHGYNGPANCRGRTTVHRQPSGSIAKCEFGGQYYGNGPNGSIAQREFGGQYYGNGQHAHVGHGPPPSVGRPTQQTRGYGPPPQAGRDPDWGAYDEGPYYAPEAERGHYVRASYGEQPWARSDWFADEESRQDFANPNWGAYDEEMYYAPEGHYMRASYDENPWPRSDWFAGEESQQVRPTFPRGTQKGRGTGNVRSLRTGNSRLPLYPKPLTPTSTAESIAQGGSNKKCLVEVNDNRWVTGTCQGKNRWLTDLKSEVLRWLDLSIISLANQHPDNWQQVVDNLAAKWRYVGHPEGVDMACLQSQAKVILRNERWRFHVLFQDAGEDPEMPAPLLIDPLQWRKLVRYFLSDSGKRKSEQMTYARGNVQNFNLTGRKGFAPIATQLKKQKGRSPTKEEVRAAVRSQRKYEACKPSKNGGGLSSLNNLSDRLKSMESQKNELSARLNVVEKSVEQMVQKQNHYYNSIMKVLSTSGSSGGLPPSSVSHGEKTMLGEQMDVQT